MVDKTEIIELLSDLRTWMVENDYECGAQGSLLYNKIYKLQGQLEEEQNGKTNP